MRRQGWVGRMGLWLLGSVVLAGVAGARPALAQDTGPPLTREAIEEIVRQYLMDHPEVILESVQAYQARQRAQQREQAKAAVAARRADLVEDPASPVGGNARGDVTVVEFFDYRCPHCKRVAPTLRQLVAEDQGVRVVYKELPILGPDSVFAARAALAAREQGKYLVFHEALMAADQPLTAAETLRIAGEVELDTEKLEAAMDAPEIEAALKKNSALAEALGIRGTPAFVVGAELVPGAVDLATFKGLVAKARAQ